MAGETTEASGDLRSQILAEISALPAGEAKPTEEAKPDEPAPAPEAAEVEESGDDEAGPDEDSPDDESSDETVDEEVDEDADTVLLKSDDPETQKRFDAVRKAEKRMRQAAERREADFEAKQRDWQAKVDKVAEYDALFKRGKYDPAALLRAAGYTEDDFELAAHSIYAESKAASADPKQKAAAQARLREREKEDKLSATEKRIAELEKRLEDQAAQQRAQAEAAAYIQQLNSASAKYPLVAHLLKVDAEDTSDQLVATYNRLTSDLKRAPKPAEVIAAYDKAERARLQRRGIDPSTIVKTQPAKKPANANTPAKPEPKPTNGHTNGAKKMTPDEERRAILAEIESLKSAQA